uniref:Uncharacterized protein n=1 Tax=Anguilla anguilla TaxID=7936 RepID=A0A0E9RLD6_ANGAN
MSGEHTQWWGEKNKNMNGSLQAQFVVG